MNNTLKISANTVRKIVNKILKVNILNKKRERKIVDARYIYYSICYYNLKMTVAAISRTTKHNHATVLHGLKQADSLYEVDVDFRDRYYEILRICQEMNKAVKSGSKEDEIDIVENSVQHEIKMLNKKIVKMELEYETLTNKYLDMCSKKTMLGGINIPEEHEENVRERIQMYLDSLKWKGSGYDGKVYNSTDNTSKNTY